LEVWEVVAAAEYSVLPQGLQSPLGAAHSLDISPDGRLLAISRSKGLEVWDLVSEHHWLETGIQNSLIKFTQNGDLIVSCKSSVTRWPRKIQSPTSDTASELLISYGPPQQLTGASDDLVFAIDPPGRTLAVEPPWNGGRVIHANKPAEVVRLPIAVHPRRMAISSDGQWVAVAHAFSRGATVFSAITGQRVANLSPAGDALPLFSSDNRWLATSSEGVQVWRASDWQLATELHTQRKTWSAQEIAFSPDSRVLAVGQPSGAIRLVDPATGKDWATLNDPHGSPGAFLAFTPDQSKLIALADGDNGAPRIWNLAAIRRGLADHGLDWPEDVLGPLTNARSIADSARVDITFNVGNFPQKQEAMDFVSKSAGTSAERALELNKQAVRMDPECGLAHNNIARLLAIGPELLRDPDGSLVHARRAVSLEPGHQGYLNTLGIALCRNALYDEAIQVLNRSLKLSVDDGKPFDLLFLALAQAGKGDAQAARDCYTEAETWFNQHRTQMPSNMREEFIRLLEESRPAVWATPQGKKT
jgi:anaphase-promoting complex subunit 4